VAGFGDSLEQSLLNHIMRGNTGGTAFAQPTALWVSLHTATLNDDGTGTEVSGGAYARVNSFTCWANAPEAGVLTNAAKITFPEATADWGTVTHFGIWSANSAGTLYLCGALSAPKLIQTGDVPEWDVGDISITLD
jgi:hypothetical protein